MKFFDNMDSSDKAMAIGFVAILAFGAFAVACAAAMNIWGKTP